MSAKSRFSTLLLPLAAAALAQATPPSEVASGLPSAAPSSSHAAPQQLLLRARATVLAGRELVALEFESELPRIAVAPQLLQALMRKGQVMPDAARSDGRTLVMSRLAAERLIASTTATSSPEATAIVESDGAVRLE